MIPLTPHYRLTIRIKDGGPSFWLRASAADLLTVLRVLIDNESAEHVEIDPVLTPRSTSFSTATTSPVIPRTR